MATAQADATYPSLAGKAVLVTGGANGIGRAIAIAFADQGAQVTVLDVDVAAGDALAASVGEGLRFVECDVADAERLRSAIDDAASAFGRLDVLVANAGDDERHEAREVTPELWESSLALNLNHQFFAAQAAEPHLRAAGGGAIVCLGSIAWLNNTTGMVAYTTAKAGVHGLVRTLARMWGEAGIRVNALVPGWTMTDKQMEQRIDVQAERQIEEAQALPGFVMPDDIARAALFLASDEARMITQQSLIVDGGWV